MLTCNILNIKAPYVFKTSSLSINLTQDNSTAYKKKCELDQFYTKEEISKKCYDLILSFYKESDFSLFIEPSAGNGSFLSLFPKDNRVGLDLAPKNKEIQKMDFFDYCPPKNNKIITIGNPPFGRICSTAIKFFNKAAEYSNVIAFIIPKTFKKDSLKNKLNKYFHLKAQFDLPKNSFIYNGESYDVPCCFQIWEKSSKQREIIKINLENELFDFASKEQADLSVRRVGGNAGKAYIDDINLCSETSNYFLKLKSNKLSKIKLMQAINNIDNSDIINSTAGVRSLSKQEFISQLRKYGIINVK
jgi:hypothetical protein